MTKPFIYLSYLLCTFVALAAEDTALAGKGGEGLKKGFGLPERHGKDEAYLELLNVSWYYNWGSQTKSKTRATFVPMIFSLKTESPKAANNDFILGFNEPDHPKQANLPLKEAIDAWAGVATKGRTVIGPAMAGNPLTGDWLPGFMKAKVKVDAIAVHWYKGVDAKKLIKDLEEIHARYKKPIWLTEFAPQTHASSEEAPRKFTQAQVTAFLQESAEFFEKTPWLVRYAWHDSVVGTSALFTEKGELTATGKAYAALKK